MEFLRRSQDYRDGSETGVVIIIYGKSTFNPGIRVPVKHELESESMR